MKKQTGFSLVELVIVIIVVGLLAVAALPRFMNVTDEAKKASIQGVAGGFATAVLSARAQWEANGRPVSGSYNVVNYDGQNFYLTTAGSDQGVISEGYPLAESEKNIRQIQSSDCAWLMENLMQNPPKVTSVAESATKSDYAYLAKADNAQCNFYQLASAAAGSNGDAVSAESGHKFVYNLANGQVEVQLVN
ncbi:prepilin-type N-terminal cleavage/methylation domain-containing protein [Photobacterium sp. MCCC 1A19761]|uniref:prepilin-type N-terminal cleavage/methylation domain-containing protein n=1 Tax=Photobacterium sp. MCCC 1A19761 TaxID=3115000 RepID=UPI00307D2913